MIRILVEGEYVVFIVIYICKFLMGDIGGISEWGSLLCIDIK